MSTSDEERRSSNRVDAIVLVQVAESDRYGVSRDVSEKGVLIATRFRFTAGDRLELAIHGVNGVVTTMARVVRVETSPPEEAWAYQVALELDTPIPREIIEHGAKAATRLLPTSKLPPPLA